VEWTPSHRRATLSTELDAVPLDDLLNRMRLFECLDIDPRATPCVACTIHDVHGSSGGEQVGR